MITDEFRISHAPAYLKAEQAQTLERPRMRYGLLAPACLAMLLLFLACVPDVHAWTGARENSIGNGAADDESPPAGEAGASGVPHSGKNAADLADAERILTGTDWLKMSDLEKRWYVSMAMLHHSQDGIPVRHPRERYVRFIDTLLATDPSMARHELRAIFTLGLEVSDPQAKAAMERVFTPAAEKYMRAKTPS